MSEIMNDTIQPIFKIPTYRSKIFITPDTAILSEKKYNWFNKLMYKVLLDWKVEVIK